MLRYEAEDVFLSMARGALLGLQPAGEAAVGGLEADGAGAAVARGRAHARGRADGLRRRAGRPRLGGGRGGHVAPVLRLHHGGQGRQGAGADEHAPRPAHDEPDTPAGARGTAAASLAAAVAAAGLSASSLRSDFVQPAKVSTARSIKITIFRSLIVAHLLICCKVSSFFDEKGIERFFQPSFMNI